MGWCCTLPLIHFQDLWGLCVLNPIRSFSQARLTGLYGHCFSPYCTCLIAKVSPPVPSCLGLHVCPAEGFLLLLLSLPGSDSFCPLPACIRDKVLMKQACCSIQLPSLLGFIQTDSICSLPLLIANCIHYSFIYKLNGERTVFSTEGTEKLDTHKEVTLINVLHQHIKINLNWIIDLNVKQTIKSLEENFEKHIYNFGFGKDF